MKKTICFLGTLFIASATFAAIRQATVEVPDGPGKPILEMTCTSCHGLDSVAKNEGLGQDGWRMIVDRMSQNGASLTPEQSPVLIQYLADYFGEGRKILDTSCTACHGLNEVKKFQGFYKREDWQDVVVTMVKYGADVKEAQVPNLVDYLTRVYSKR